ncbi:DUF3311 domain-containing protein [Acidiphilium sp. AL]|uniref:DUF3311 domain-containing protein n=1 Tax=Acidiphilium iwatense TaxID=768198 RepID=A0ABS9DUL3_9PROT|nr:MULTISPECIES: DUF3311 domain-containing protein [Acidiphilium]MCF3946414.1 DUF3311 domain-containing protein [Acidiphilium iwatense]MCU4158590.1 DUF3311 domain-containing protein [Acidiphilium sp. AL]
MADPSHEPAPRTTPWRILLIIPFIATLWVPFFNMKTPEFGGFPFFYWYQLLWVPLSALIIFIVYRTES